MRSRVSRAGRTGALLAAALCALCVLACGVPACAQEGSAAGPLPLGAFDYHRAAPLDAREEPGDTVDGVEIRTVSFASPHGGRATGLLFVPARPGRFAGIVLQHGMPGSAATMGRHGVYLARRGAVVVALDAPLSRREGPSLRFTPADSAEQVQLIVDLRRAVDLLVARPDVDPTRLAYVGRSYGAAMGALFAGVERRLRTYVLMVGNGGLVSHLIGRSGGPLDGLPREERRRWLAAMRPIEPIRFVHLAPPASILFQSARRDELVSVSSAEQLHRAARTPKSIRWYDAGHALTPQAYVDQLEWLRRTVGTDRPRPGDRRIVYGPLPEHAP